MDIQTLVLIGNRNVARTSEQRIRSNWTDMATMLLPSQLVVDAISFRRRIHNGRLESQLFLWLESIAARVAH